MVMKINFIRLEILEDQKKSAQLQSVLSWAYNVKQQE